MSAFWLKWMALASMLIDHIGAVFFGDFTVRAFGADWEILRMVGRLAFPILAFQIAQGAAHTSNWKKYALRLLAFGLVSELPYDLALHGGVDWTNQNVYFTLLLGLLAIEADMKWAARDWKAGRFKGMIFAALLMLLGFIIGSDYGGFGVLMIYWFYLAGSDSLMTAGGIAAINFVLGRIQAFGVLALIPISLYNRKLGYHRPWLQYTCYLFYPVHLAVLAAVRAMAG